MTLVAGTLRPSTQAPSRPPRESLPMRRIDRVDELLDAHAADIGNDWTGYHNHVYRVANLCLALAPEGDDVLDKVSIAVALHDIGIWTARTFDYLEPSTGVAMDYLARSGRAAWTGEISAMIEEHHKVRAYRDHPDWLVEPFRKADWIDVTYGVLNFGLSRRYVSTLYATWPDAGFHRNLVRLTLGRARRHPLSPLPMLRL